MKKISISFPVVLLISIIIQGAGLIRSLLLANSFGAHFEIDAFYLANVFTISVFTIVSNTITTIVIPELSTNNNDAKKVVEKYASLITIISVILSMILFFGVFIFSDDIVPKFNVEYRQLFVLLTAILLISQQFRIQASLMTATFQFQEHYIVPRMMDMIPAIIPVGYLLIVHKIDIITLTVITAVSYILETYVLRRTQKVINPSFLMHFSVGVNNQVKLMMRNTIPILLSSMVFQIQILASNYFAGSFGDGYITLLSNTNQIMGIFQMLIVTNLINMVYPRLVEKIKQSLLSGLKVIPRYIIFTNLIVILLLWGYTAVGNDLVKLLFLRGAFTNRDANLVYMFSVILGFAIPIDVIRDYCYRAYYSVGNTKKPMINSLITVVFNVITLMILSHLVGYFSIVIAPVCGTVLSTFMILNKMFKDRMNFRLKKIFISYVVINVFGFFMFFLIKKIEFHANSLLVTLIGNVGIGAVFILFGIICLVPFKNKIMFFIDN